MRINPLIVLALMVLIPRPASPAKIDEEIAAVRKEITALRELKVRKMDELERAEAARWNARYAHNEEMKLQESRARQLESRYASVAGELNRTQEDILLLKNALDDEREGLQEKKAAFDGFTLQVQQALEDAAEKLENDFPWQIADRTALYSSLQQQLARPNPAVGQVMGRMLADRRARIGITDDQRLTTRATLFNDGQERTAWNLRLGSVVMTDIAKNEPAVQTLLRTGSLEGPRYSWRSGLGETYFDDMITLIGAAQSGKRTEVPLDVLQNGKVGTGETTLVEASLWSRFKEWFGKGGLIMYPLLACAITALLLSLERFIKLTWRHHRFNRSRKRLMPLIDKGDWDNAQLYCRKACTGLTRAIHAVVTRRNGSREAAEQHVRQILLAEVPSLEKRLSIISTLGSTAPLLGLLGTVSGMITLFRVITETGTNDARILAGGISEALVTTQTGLLVAIPILLIHGFLMERLDNILSHYNETVMEAFNIVFNKEKPEA